MFVSIQYLRGVAAMLVVFHHLLVQLERHGSGALTSHFAVGQAGVDIFFVVSGFIMVFISSRKNLGVLDFWRDRIIRVVPLYWVYSLAMIAIAYLLPGLLHTAVFDPLHALKSLFFIPAYHPGEVGRIWPILVQGWTLNYEMFFYLIFGLTLISAKPSSRMFVLSAAFLILIATGLLFDLKRPFEIVYTNTILAEFLYGCVAGYLYTRELFPGKRVGLFLFLSGVLGLVLSVILPGWGGVRAITWGLPALFLLVGAVSIEKESGIFKSFFLRKVGDSSYSLYLIHTFVLGVVGFVWGKVSAGSLITDCIFLSLGFTLSLAAGMLSYMIIEKPLISLFKNKSVRKKRN